MESLFNKYNTQRLSEKINYDHDKLNHKEKLFSLRIQVQFCLLCRNFQHVPNHTLQTESRNYLSNDIKTNYADQIVFKKYRKR